MNWQEIFTIIVPMIAFMGWIYSRIDKKFEQVEKRFDKIDNRLERMEEKMQSLDSRVSRIEGQMNSPYHWEAKIKDKAQE